MPFSSNSRRTTLEGAYDHAAGWWQEKISKLGYPTAYRQLIGTEPPRAGSAVIDIGAGTGALAEALLDRATPGQLDLLDISHTMLQTAAARMSKRFPVRTIRKGIGETWAHEPYDVALMAHVVEHLSDPLEALRWTRSKLRMGGKIYMVASRPHWCTAILRWKWGHQAYHPDEMTILLRQAGFDDIRTVTFACGPPSRTSMGYIARA